MSHLVLSLLVATTSLVSVFGGSCNFAHGYYVWAIDQCFIFTEGTTTQFILFECDPNTNSPVLHLWLDDTDTFNDTFNDTFIDCPDPTLVTPYDTDTRLVGECSSTQDNCKVIEMKFTVYDTVECTGNIVGTQYYYLTDAANDICFPVGTRYVLANVQDTSIEYTIYSDDQCTQEVGVEENFSDGVCSGNLFITITVVDDGLGDGMFYLFCISLLAIGARDFFHHFPYSKCFELNPILLFFIYYSRARV